VLILSQNNRVRATPSHLLKIHFNIIQTCVCHLMSSVKKSGVKAAWNWNSIFNLLPVVLGEICTNLYMHTLARIKLSVGKPAWWGTPVLGTTTSLVKFDVHRAMHCNIICIVKPTRCTSVSNLFYFGMTLYMFRTVFPSIIRSSRLYIQQQVSVSMSFQNKINLIHWCI